jgi:N-acetylglutamate synthase-like GNAT family acetyltransferase
VNRGGKEASDTRPNRRRQPTRTVTKADVSLRTELRPGDIGRIVHLHGVIYAKEYGFDSTFEAYVAGPLADFALSGSARSRLWIAESKRGTVGCIAIVELSHDVAQLRWYLVDPSARGAGIGGRLLSEALDFCRACGYRSVVLWTVDALAAAAHLYRSAGFQKVEEKPGSKWGVRVTEEKYELELTADRPRPDSSEA